MVLLLNLAISYFVGLTSFFAGCLVPVAPIYVSFLAGSGKFRRNAIFFTLGFVSVFLFMGLTINTVARSLVAYQDLVEHFGGLLIIIMGLFYLDILKIPFLNKTYMKKFNNHISSAKTSFLLGLVFSFAWTPCIGPVLASILFLVAVIPDYSQGIPLLLAFSAGLVTPFILLGLAMQKLLPFYKKINTHSSYIKKIAGLTLITLGILYFMGTYATITSRLFLTDLHVPELELIQE